MPLGLVIAAAIRAMSTAKTNVGARSAFARISRKSDNYAKIVIALAVAYDLRPSVARTRFDAIKASSPTKADGAILRSLLAYSDSPAGHFMSTGERN